MRCDDERLADIVEAADKISVRAEKGRQAFDASEDGTLIEALDRIPAQHRPGPTAEPA